MTMTPSRFDELRGQYDVIPVVRELSADTLTPVAAFAALAQGHEDAFLLESVERGESLGRYSFLGVKPRKSMTLARGSITPIETLRDELIPLRVFEEDSLPPFFGGAVGYFGYGAAGWSERLPDRHRSGEVPDAKLLFFDHVVAFDHLRQRLFVIANVFTSETGSALELLAAARRRIDEIVHALRAAKPDLTPLPFDAPLIEFASSTTREQFVEMVSKAKEEIAAGEIFQVVLSQSWSAPFAAGNALTLYRALRAVNPSPYMFLLRTDETTLVGASPEMLVRVVGSRAETRPIAGTRPRGGTSEEDVRLGDELLADPKENAEHLMLVDLGRNDLGRVCSSGTVQVTEFRHIERYSHVMHIVSSVEGDLRKDRAPIDAFFSCFPAGTVSGAPKIRAMELVDELEPARRNVYAGAVVYIGFSGNLDSCIAIRTITLEGNRATVQAGAGIVYDSVPDKEWEETLSKSAALKRALSIASEQIRRIREDAFDTTAIRKPRTPGRKKAASS